MMTRAECCRFHNHLPLVLSVKNQSKINLGGVTDLDFERLCLNWSMRVNDTEGRKRSNRTIDFRPKVETCFKLWSIRTPTAVRHSWSCIMQQSCWGRIQKRGLMRPNPACKGFEKFHRNYHASARPGLGYNGSGSHADYSHSLVMNGRTKINMNEWFDGAYDWYAHALCIDVAGSLEASRRMRKMPRYLGQQINYKSVRISIWKGMIEVRCSLVLMMRRLPQIDWGTCGWGKYLVPPPSVGRPSPSQLLTYLRTPLPPSLIIWGSNVLSSSDDKVRAICL